MKVEKGDVVRLAASVTLAEFGLALCDNDGAGLEIDRVVGRVEPHMVNMSIRRLMVSSSICGHRRALLAAGSGVMKYWV